MNESLVMINDYRLGNASMVSTMPCNSEDEKKRVINGLNNATASLGDMVNVPFNLQGFYSELSEKVDEETGEVVPMKSTVLFADDGSSYGTSSESVLKTLMRIAMMYEGRDLYKEPLAVVAKQRKCKKGNVTTLEIV